MPLQSQPVDASDAKSVVKKKEKLPFWVYFADLPDAVPWFAFLGAAIWFNKSDFGRTFYANLAKQFPNKRELADHMMQTITGKAAAGTFWVMASLFAVLDIWHWPKFLYSYKIQGKPGPNLWYWLKIALINNLNTFLILGPVGKNIIYPLWIKRGGPEHAMTIPSALTTIKEFLVCEAWFEFWLYTSHRIMHLPFFYSWTHKMHHLHTNPFTVANFYSTPFEQVFQNAISGIAMQALPVHPSTAWFFGAFRYFETATSHSGYALPMSTNAISHNYHHRMFEGLYGIHLGIPIMDLICGTADDYLQWRYKWSKTHHWFTNRPLKSDEEARAVEKELDVEGVDRGGAGFKEFQAA